MGQCEYHFVKKGFLNKNEMLPLQLLNNAKEQGIMVELKNGETYNGKLTSCDNWMNLVLSNVVCTSSDGMVFTSMSNIYLAGKLVKYLRIPEQVVEQVKDRGQSARRGGRGGRGKSDRGGRGRGRGSSNY